MAIDREDTLKKAEKLLRQGKLDAAIGEYVRVVEEQPRDWNTINTLGDLYVRAGHADKAAAQYGRIADHFMREGFFPKAAALYKKILKIKPDDEAAQLHLGELSVRQGLLADAKAYLTAVAERRRGRGDRRGATEIVVRLGDLDPADFDARAAAARGVADMGDEADAAARFRTIADDLIERGREADALGALRESIQLDPYDHPTRARLAKALLAAGDVERARSYLDGDTAGDDPTLLLALGEIELRGGRTDEARAVLTRLLTVDPARRAQVVELSWALCDGSPPAALVCVETAADAAVAAGDWADAAAALDEFVNRVPGQIPALLKLVEICVDGGLEGTMYLAQAQLVDAYLAAGQAGEARVIAEDLVAREPWEQAHIDRFRQALIMLRTPDPDSVIAERLSGYAPFTATDPFVDPEDLKPERLMAATPAAVEPPPSPEPVQAAAAAAGRGSGSSDSRPARPAAVDDIFEIGTFELTPRPPAPSSRPAGAGEIDLTGVLTDLKGEALSAPQPMTLDDAFKGFRDEVARQTGADAATEQLKVGRTCLETGMLDDAVKALEAAARSPRLRFEAGVLLARIYKQKNDPPHAVEWLERAAEAPAPSADHARALLYELGCTLEGMGETARALAVFLELQADAGAYRDVGPRVDRLSRAQTGG